MAKELANESGLHVISPLPWFPNLSIFRNVEKFRQWAMFSSIPAQDVYDEIPVEYPKYFFLPKIGYIFQPVAIFLATFSKIRVLHKQGKVDVINAHWIYPDAIAAVYMAKKLGVPCVISARGCDINRYSNSFIRRLQTKWALQHADGITVVSNALKDKIIAIYKTPEEKISIIPNGVDSGVFKQMSQIDCQRELGLNSDKKKLLFVGQLQPVKSVDTLIRALSILKNEGKLDFETLIVGEGPLREQLESLAKELQLDEADISFKGQQAHDKVASYFGAADLLCLPSIREGRPNVIIEALATGLPVVASSVGGIPELINDKNGALVPPSSPEKLSQALATSINKKWQRKEITEGSNSSSWSHCSEQYYSLFSKIISNKKCTS